MAVTAVEVRRHNAQQVTVNIEVDGDSITEKVLIPSPLPDGVASKKDYVRQEARSAVKRYRLREQFRAEKQAVRDGFDGAGTSDSSDADDILTDLNS